MLLVADEVQTGMGRTGKMFAVEHWNVEPDILCLAKGIASGFPLGAFIAREEIADSFSPGDHMSTFGGNPVSCAAGVATIDMIVEERLPERAARVGSMVMARLDAFAEECELVGDVRGSGLMIGVELVRNRATKEPATAEAAAVKRHCRERGVLISRIGQADNILKIRPPMTFSTENADLLVTTLDAVLSEV